MHGAPRAGAKAGMRASACMAARDALQIKGEVREDAASPQRSFSSPPNKGEQLKRCNACSPAKRAPAAAPEA
jgi:hypothetical protein